MKKVNEKVRAETQNDLRKEMIYDIYPKTRR